MSQPHEFYRYATPGEQQHLLMIKAGSSHIWLEGSQKITHFNLTDRLGSLSSVVDEQGVLVSRETWYPFGGTVSWLTNLTSDSLDPPPPVAVAALVTLESPKRGPSCDPVPMLTQKAFVKRCPTCSQVFKSQYL